MSRDEIRTHVLECLSKIAPEASLAPLSPNVPFREQLDFDPMDFLNFVEALDEALPVAVPESDYGALTTLNDCIAYFDRAKAS